VSGTQPLPAGAPDYAEAGQLERDCPCARSRLWVKNNVRPVRKAVAGNKGRLVSSRGTWPHRPTPARWVDGRTWSN